MIIGFSGYAGAGKGEAAKPLIEAGFEHRAFADKLRELIEEINPAVPTEGGGYGWWYTYNECLDTWGYEGSKKQLPAFRQAVQDIGSATRKVLGEDVWVDAATRGLDPFGEWDIVFTDVRFPNEARRIKDLGGRVIRITRPGVGPANSHESETALDRWIFDEEIINDSTIYDLHMSVFEAARS